MSPLDVGLGRGLQQNHDTPTCDVFEVKAPDVFIPGFPALWDMAQSRF